MCPPVLSVCAAKQVVCLLCVRLSLVVWLELYLLCVAFVCILCAAAGSAVCCVSGNVLCVRVTLVTGSALWILPASVWCVCM